MGFHVAVIIVEERDHGGGGAEQDTDEGETFGAEGEVVGGDENDGEGFEPEVEEAVDECQIEVQQETDGFRKGQGEGTDEDHHSDFLPGHAFGFNLRLAFHARVVG